MYLKYLLGWPDFLNEISLNEDVLEARNENSRLGFIESVHVQKLSRFYICSVIFKMQAQVHMHVVPYVSFVTLHTFWFYEFNKSPVILSVKFHIPHGSPTFLLRRLEEQFQNFFIEQRG